MRNLSFVKRMTALGMALMFLVAANVKRVEAAPANNLTPEQIEAIVTDVFNKFAAFDAQGTAALYAPDGTKTRSELPRYREHKPSLLTWKRSLRS